MGIFATIQLSLVGLVFSFLFLFVVFCYVQFGLVWLDFLFILFSFIIDLLFVCLFVCLFCLFSLVLVGISQVSWMFLSSVAFYLRRSRGSVWR